MTDARALEILRCNWEKAKQKLSRIPQVNIATYLPGIEVEFKKDVTRADFEQQCSPLFDEITAEIRKTLLKAQVCQSLNPHL